MKLTSATSSPRETLSKIRLLLVEDDTFTREQLARLLGRVTAEVLEAGDGSEGLAVFKQQQPDMVLTDLNMPVMDGLSMAAIIKAHSPDVPIIAATAHNDELYLQRALEVGLDGYLAKPLDLDSLIPALYKHARLVLARKLEDDRARLFSYLLDINPHLIISAARGQVDYVNETFLEYVGLSSLEEMLSGNPGRMREIHIEGQRYSLHDFSWIARASSIDAPRTLACFSPEGDRCEAENTFWMASRRFDDLDRVVVTLTDITPLEQERTQLLYRATTDSLTGVANRYKLSEYIRSEHTRFKRYNTPTSLIMFDIDHFKHVNDTFGHQRGDIVLAELAGLVARSIRDTDTLGRWGGEEFMILTPETPGDEAYELAERLREIVEGHAFPGAGSITCSFGVSSLTREDTLDALLARVDAALYKAKASGRNRAVSD